jgi:hypothetical protein
MGSSLEQLFLTTPRTSYTNIVAGRETARGVPAAVESLGAILYNPRNLAARSLAGLEYKNFRMWEEFRCDAQPR